MVFHTLRHTYITQLMQAGVHPHTMKELAGHSSLQMTERYTHGNMGQKQVAVEALERQFNGGS